MAIIVIITKASVSSLESSCFSTYSGAPQGHHVIFPAKGPPPCPLPHIYHCYISYINISLLHPRWDEQCRDTMMPVPPQLTSSLPSFSYPASFRHPPPASSFKGYLFSQGFEGWHPQPRADVQSCRLPWTYSCDAWQLAQLQDFTQSIRQKGPSLLSLLGHRSFSFIFCFGNILEMFSDLVRMVRGVSNGPWEVICFSAASSLSHTWSRR